MRRNAVALISLSVALFSTSYNTWRNQTTEAHRNVREAAFKLIEEAGELEQIAQRRHYGGDRSQMNWIDGWGRAALIRDLGALVSPQVEARAETVFATWKENAGDLAADSGEAEKRIADSLAAMNAEIRSELVALR